MHALTRKLLIPYLVLSTLFAPLAPTFAQATHAAAVHQQQSLPELGGSKPEPSSTKPDDALPADWQLRADTARDLAPGVLRDRTQGVDEAMAQGAGMLSSAASEASQAWFAKHKITSELNLKVDQTGLHGGSLDVLVPFYNASKSLAFVQGGIRRMDTYTDDYRNTVNMGVGYRHDVGNWMLGANTFFDRDLTGKNDRVGLGVEAWTDFLKLSANSYSPLSTWKASPDKTDYLERPAKGWDVRAEGYLPAYPQLGGKLAYEQYYGKNVSLFSADDQQKDPHAMTVGVIYNPIPLVSVGVDHRMGQGGLADTSANLTFNYRIGESFAKQVSSDNVMASHLLANMRYDLVSRNNEMVMDHQKVGGELRLPAVLSGTEDKAVQFPVTGSATVQSVSWVGSAAPFATPYTGSGQGTLTLPAYDSTGSNIYSLQAAGTDKSGRTVLSNVMTVEVLSVGMSLNLSAPSLPADGTSTTTLTAKITDAQPQRARSVRMVNWSTTAGTLSAKTSTVDANGEASVVLTSPTVAGTGTVEASMGSLKRSAPVTFTAGAANALTVSANPTAIEADGRSTSTLSADVKDTHGNPVGAGVSVSWSTDAGTLASATSSTNASGIATVVLTSATAAGTATVHATSGKASGSASVSFTAGAAAAIAVTAAPASIVADGSSTSTLSASVKDGKGNPVAAGVTVSWSTTAGTLAAPTSTTNASGVATIELTSATAAGTATVQASAGKEHGSATVNFTAGAASTLTVTVAPDAIAANGSSTSTLSATVKDAHGNPVASGVSVNWTTTAGSLASPTSTTDAHGVATIVLTSSTSAGDASVQAAVGAAKASATVSFTAGAADTLSVSASPTSIEANGSSTSTLIAMIKDAHGNPVGAGVSVSWTTSAGTLASPTSTTNTNGQATVQLTSSTTSGDATVQAAVGSAKASAVVRFTAGAATALTVSANPASIEANGSSTSTLSATVKDGNGNLVAAGVTVNWTTSAGSLASPSSTTDANGVASIVLTSATSAGDATVQAAVGSVKASATVSFTAGAADALTVTASPTSIEANGSSTSTLSTTVKDSHGNPVGAGVSVNWSTSAGSLDHASSTTNASGVATAVLTSATTASDASVQASVGAAKGSATVSFTAGSATTLSVSANPTSIEANGSSTSTLSATVKDAHGNTVAAGVTVNWTTSAGSLDHASSTTNASGVATAVLTSATAAGDASVKASAGSASDTATVSFTAGSATALSVSASPTSIEANGSSTSTLTTTVKDAHGNTVGAGITVAWSTDLGSLASATSLTNASGEATVVLTSATSAGNATVQAAVGSAKASATVSFTAGAANSLSVSANPAAIEANGSSTSTLSATVKDAHGNTVAAGVTVNWTTTAGSLDHASSTTNASGVATVVLTSSTSAGEAKVSATSGSATGDASVSFTAGAPTALVVSASPTSIVANGSSTSTISTTVKDAHGNTAGAGVTVSWTTSAGHLASASSTTNANGVATVVLTSATAAGNATVQAASGSASGSVSVSFTAGAASSLIVSANPASIVADGSSTSTLSSTVKDAYGNPVGAGVTVNWTTSAGSLDHASSTTNTSGVATVVLTSTTAVGDARVNATSGTASGSATVSFTAGAASSLSISASPISIVANGTSTSTLSSTVKDAHGHTVGAGVTVNWTTSAGSLDHASSTTNASGVATVVLTSATTAGDATVQATSGAATASASVTFTPGAASSLSVSANPAAIDADGSSTTTLSATVKDSHGNLVAAGVRVIWSTDAGSLASASSLTDVNGVATAMLTSSNSVEDASVRATAGAASNTVTVSFTAGAVDSLAVKALPNRLFATGTSTSTLTATLKDAHGNSVGAGVTVNWSTSAGSLAHASSTTDANGEATVELTSATTVGVATVQATSGAITGSTTVTFTPGNASTLTLSAAPTSIVADGSSTLTLSATVQDAHGNAVGAGTNVKWQRTAGVAGSLASVNSLTDANGVATVVLTSGTTVGDMTVAASVGAVNNSIIVSFTAGAASSVAVSATPTSIEANGTSTSTLSASVKDANDNPVGAGVTVNWSTTSGDLADASTTTNASGVATVVLTSSTKAGPVTLQATSGAALGTTTVTFTPGAADTLAVSANPTSIVADGTSTATLSASVKDAYGNAVGAGVTVNWSSSIGSLDHASSTTNASGVATVVLTSSTTSGDATVQATSGAASSSATVTFTVGAPSTMALTATPDAIVADGTTTSTLSTTVKDANGNLVGAGVTVNWTTSAGALASASSATDANGVATMVLTSPTKTGTASVQAEAGAAKGAATVTFIPGALSSLTVVSDPDSLYANGAMDATVSATARDVYGNLLGSGVTVNWTATDGTLGRTSSTTDAKGVATVVLTSSRTVGGATVQAVSGSTSGSIRIDFLDAPNKTVLSAEPRYIVADGATTSTISATVTGINGAPLAGLTVNFTTNNGTLTPSSSVTDANGVATVVLTSSTKTGSVAVRTSISGWASASGTSMQFTPIPASITISGGDQIYDNGATKSVNLAALVKDATGKHVGGLTTVSWSSNGGSLGSTTSETSTTTGKANNTLTSTNFPETITVQVTAGKVTQSIDVVFP